MSGNNIHSAKSLSRRKFLQAGVASAGAAALASCAAQPIVQNVAAPTASSHDGSGMAKQHADSKADETFLSYDAGHLGHNSLTVGEVDHQAIGFDPMKILVEFDAGKVSQLPDGQTLREYTIYAEDKEIEIAPGVKFPAWTYNGRVPGPTLRCTEGDRLRVEFINGSSHPHSMHFHGIHPIEMDGVPGTPGGDVAPGGRFVYEFDAEPFGFFPYHCHVTPIKRHIHKGLYGSLVIDPKEGRPPAREFVMVMNAFDTNFDGGNEVYAVNTVAFEFVRRMIPIKVGELVRIYLYNMVEFDLLNSFHLHANMFNYYDHGTTLEPTLRTVDAISQVQGQRGILEFRYKYPGRPMFHAHVSEFTELGWMGHFNVVKPEDFVAAMREVGLNEEWDYRALNSSTVAHA